MKRKVIVVMGGWSPEAPVSLRSGLNAFQELPAGKYSKRAVVLNVDRRAAFLPEGVSPNEENLKDCVYRNLTEVFSEVLAWGAEAALLALHGRGGEDGAFQGFLSTLGIPFTHSGVTASAVAMEKDIAKLLYAAAGVRIPRGVTVCATDDPAEEVRKASLSYPLIAKPLASGSSFGLWLLQNENELREKTPEFWKNGSLYLLEEFVKGREFTCVVITRKGCPCAMPVTEIVSRTGVLFDFKAKYTKGSSEEITPARISGELSDKIREAAVKCHQALRCAGVSRTDFMVNDKEEVFALETNTIPGMSAASILPGVARNVGIDFSQILDEMVEEAIRSANNNC